MNNDTIKTKTIKPTAIVKPTGHGLVMMFIDTGEFITNHTDINDDYGYDTPDALESFSLEVGEF